LDNTWQANVFLLEMLLAVRKIRSSAVGIGIAASLTLLGMEGYRFNLCVVAFARPAGPRRYTDRIYNSQLNNHACLDSGDLQ